MPINLSWKVEDLAPLTTTKTYLSLPANQKTTIESCVKHGAKTTEEFQIYSNTITAVLMETREFSMLNIPKKEIFKALLKTRIKDIAYTDLLVKMNDLITWVHLQMSFKMDAKIHNATIDDFVKILKMYNTTLTVEEIQIAFDKGYRKEFGDWINLSNATYHTWIREYTFCEDRVKAVKAIADAKQFIVLPPVKELTPEEKTEILRMGAITKWNDFKSGKDIFDLGSVTYDFLHGLKLIAFDKERKLQMVEKAKLELIDEQKGKLQRMDADSVIQHKNIKGLIEDYRKGFPAPTEKNPDAVRQHPLVITHTKKIALQTYFKELINAKTDFVEILANAFETKK